MAVQTNLRIIRRSRKPPQRGDVFAMQIPDGRYLFGRVIGADLAAGQAPMPGAYLIYVYNVVRDAKVVDPNDLAPDRLLIPPIHTNRMGWTKGYFETIASGPFGPGCSMWGMVSGQLPIHRR